MKKKKEYLCCINIDGTILKNLKMKICGHVAFYGKRLTLNGSLASSSLFLHLSDFEFSPERYWRGRRSHEVSDGNRKCSMHT